MDKLRIGVIGYGFMGKMHANIFSGLPQVELTAVSDLDSSSFASAPLTGVDFYPNFKDLLDRKDIDAVSICVSDRAHCEPAVLAAQARKAIFLEKPISLDLGEARQIVQTAHQAGVSLMIGFLLRFDPRYAGVKDLLDQGQLGDPVYIHARRNSPKSEGPARYRGSTPLLFHVTIHDLDLIFWYLNKKVKSVYAQSNSKALKTYNMEDSLFAVLRFEDDTLVNLASSWALPEGNASHLDAYMEILGTLGMAKVECGYSGLWFSNAAATLFPDTMHWPQVGDRIAGDLKEELTHFVNCVLTDRAPLVTGEDGLRALELAWAIQHSIDTGEVILFE